MVNHKSNRIRLTCHKHRICNWLTVETPNYVKENGITVETVNHKSNHTRVTCHKHRICNWLTVETLNYVKENDYISK